jgi:hypothetical protein
MAILPIAKSVYVCDEVTLDPRTSKITLLNIWERLRTPIGATFPFRVERFHAFTWWKGGHQPVRTYVELVHKRTGDVIRRSEEVVIDFASRTDSAYASYRFDSCEFPESGYYCLEAFCESVFVDDQEIEVVAS